MLQTLGDSVYVTKEYSIGSPGPVGPCDLPIDPFLYRFEENTPDDAARWTSPRNSQVLVLGGIGTVPGLSDVSYFPDGTPLEVEASAVVFVFSPSFSFVFNKNG